MLYEADPAAGHVLGIDIGRGRIRLAVADLAGTVVAKVDEPNRCRSASALVRTVHEMATGVVGQAGLRLSDVVLTVVGSPGVPDRRGRMLHYAPNLPGWGRRGLLDELEAVLGPNLVNMIIVLGVAGWPIYARVVRAEAMAIREREFVLAGRALGMSHLRIIFRQVLPNLTSAIVVIATLQVAQVIIAESFLSFLGLGIQPPTPAWGNMLGEGRLYMLNSWWIATFPGLAIFITTLMINLMGNALRDWLDPHMKL